jgi:hypothetical protein
MKIVSLRFTATAALLLVVATRSRSAEMVVENLDGPVTRIEIASFKTFMQSRVPSDNNIGNDWVYGDSGKDTEALGLLYEITGDAAILDQMIRFADAALACRNDSANGRIVWTGKRELCWPNKSPETGDGKYSGSENGDVIAHIGYCAKLILKTPALGTNSVGIGDPRGYGRSYRERALTYVREMDRSLDTFILPNFVSATDSNHYRWPESDSYRALGPRYQTAPGKPVPWNQQTMLSGGFLRLAECHEILRDDPARVAKYYGIVRANMDWFLGDLHPDTRDGRTVYDWGYSQGRRSEDVPHGGYDIWGLWRAFESRRFDVPRATMTNFANTLRYVIYDSTNKVFSLRVDGTNPGNRGARNSIGASWVPLVAFLADGRPDFYHVVAEANRSGAKTKPLDDAFLLFMKHRRHQTSSTPAAGTSPRPTK